MQDERTLREINEKAARALDKKALYGEDIDFADYLKEPQDKKYPGGLGQLSKDQAETVLKAGVDVSEKQRAGTFLQMDHHVVHAQSLFPGLEIMSTTQALEKYDWLRDYYWKAVAVDSDKYTAYAHLNPYHGYFIRALPGVKAAYPLQACLFLRGAGMIQSVHNIIIAEEGSDLQILTGCATSVSKEKGVHVGISEFYVKKNAKITFTMIHNWAENIVTRPRTGTIVEENGAFLSNYICLNPVRSLQMYPKAELRGEGALARYNSILYAHAGSNIDVGSRVVLKAPNTKAEIIARAISNGGSIFARGNLRGETQPIKAHLECRGLIMGGKSSIIAIPELEGMTEGVDMSHEAAVGKIAKDEIEYLMSRGLSQNEATATIVRGFLDTSIMGLPKELEKQVDDTIKACEAEMM